MGGDCDVLLAQKPNCVEGSKSSLSGRTFLKGFNLNWFAFCLIFWVPK